MNQMNRSESCLLANKVKIGAGVASSCAMPNCAENQERSKHSQAPNELFPTKVIYVIPGVNSTAEFEVEFAADKKKDQVWSPMVIDSTFNNGSHTFVRGQCNIPSDSKHLVRLTCSTERSLMRVSSRDKPSTRTIYRVGGSNYFISPFLGNDKLSNSSALTAIMREIALKQFCPQHELEYIADMINAWPGKHLCSQEHDWTPINYAQPLLISWSNAPVLTVNEFCCAAVRRGVVLADIQSNQQCDWFRFPSAHSCISMFPTKEIPQLVEYLRSASIKINDDVDTFVYSAYVALSKDLKHSNVDWLLFLLERLKDSTIERQTLVTMLKSDADLRIHTSLRDGAWLQPDDIQIAFKDCKSAQEFMHRQGALLKDISKLSPAHQQGFANAASKLLKNPNLKLHTHLEISSVQELTATVDLHHQHEIFCLVLTKVSDSISVEYLATLSLDDLIQFAAESASQALVFREASPFNSSEPVAEMQFCRCVTERLKTQMKRIVFASRVEAIQAVQNLRVVANNAVSAFRLTEEFSSIFDAGLRGLLTTENVLDRAAVFHENVPSWPPCLAFLERKAILEGTKEFSDRLSLFTKLRELASDKHHEFSRADHLKIYAPMLQLSFQETQLHLHSLSHDEHLCAALIDALNGMNADGCRGLAKLIRHQAARTVFNAILDDQVQHPEWKFTEFTTAAQWCSDVKGAVAHLRQVIEERNCTMKLIDACESHRVELQELEASPCCAPLVFMSTSALNGISQFIYNTRKAWSDVIDTLQSIASLKIAFIHDSDVQSMEQELHEKLKNLAFTAIDKWAPPNELESIPPDLDKKIKSWKQVEQSSALARRAYNEILVTNNVSGEPNHKKITFAETLQTWTNLIEKSSKQWIAYIEELDRIPIALFRERFSFLIDIAERKQQLNERALPLPSATFDQARSRTQVKVDHESFSAHLMDATRMELNGARAYLPTLTLNLDASALQLTDALFAIRDTDVLNAAVHVCVGLGVTLPSDAPEQIYIALCSTASATASELATIHGKILAQRFHPLLAPRQFFPSLAQAVAGGTLMMLFQRFQSLHALSKKIVEATNGSTRDSEALQAFEKIHRAFSSTEGVHNDFIQLSRRRLTSSDAFFKYMEDVSWCSDILAASAAFLPRVLELLSVEVTQENVAAVVTDLMSPSAEFIITIGKHVADQQRQLGNTVTDCVRLTATTERRSTNNPFSHSELDDVGFQLMLAGTHFDAGVRFLRMDQIMKESVKLCRELFSAGHPRFQEQSLRLEMQKTVEEIEQEACSGLMTELADWKEFMRRAEDKYPLLSLLHPHERVKCLSAVDSLQDKSIDRDLLALTIRKALLPLTPTTDVLDNIKQVESQHVWAEVGKVSVGDQLSFIHQVIRHSIGNCVQHVPIVAPQHAEALKRAVAAFSDLLDNYKLRDAFNDNQGGSDIVVIQVPAADALLCSAVSIALYASICGRLPLPFELLFCNDDTSHAASFARRWGDDHSESIPNRLLFGITGVHLLKSHCQASLMDAILAQKGRRSAFAVHSAQNTFVAFSKLFLVLADEDHDSTILAQLRNSFVVSVSPEFVKRAADVCKPYCESFPITVVSSKRPSSGKTQASMRLAQERNARFASAIVDGTVPGFVDHVTQVAQGRSSEDEGIILHFSVSHCAQGDRVSEQMLEYAVLGKITDLDQGETALRSRHDHIVVEIPSEKSSRKFFAQAPSLNWCTALVIPGTILLSRVCLASPETRNCTLHQVRIDNTSNEAFSKACQVLRAYEVAASGKVQRLPHHDTLTTFGNAFDERAATELILRHCPAKLKTNFGAVVRFSQCLGTMLRGIYDFPFYKSALQNEELLEQLNGTLPKSRSHNYRALAFFLTKFSIESAGELAETSVDDAADSSNDDELSRLAKLSCDFRNSQRSFVLFTGDTYEFVTTTSDDKVLVSVFNDRWNNKQRLAMETPQYLWDSDFHSLALDLEKQKGLTVSRALRLLLQGNDNLRLDEFRLLLPILGVRPNFGISLVAALETIKTQKLNKQLLFTEAAAKYSGLSGGSAELARISTLWAKESKAPACRLSKFVARAEDWLRSLTPSPKNGTKPFILTADSFVRLLAVKTRLLCGIPVVFQGETGQGKTHLLSHLSRLSGTLFEVINVHRGLQESALLAKIQQVQNTLLATATSEGAVNFAIVVLDEVNSMKDVWVAKTLVCDRMLLGHAIMPQIQFVCIMNPWRLQESRITPGLDFVSSTHKSGLSDVDHPKCPRAAAGLRNTTPSRTKEFNLVYDVNRSPESFLDVAWDFGTAHDSYHDRHGVEAHVWNGRAFVPPGLQVTDETIFAESFLSWNLEKMTSKQNFDSFWEQLCSVGDNEGNRHFPYFRTLVIVLIDTAQKNLRDIGGIFSVSLRDIDRVVSLFSLLYDVQHRYYEFHSTVNGMGAESAFRMLRRAVAASFSLNYLLRLPDNDRGQVESALLKSWREFRDQVQGPLNENFMMTPESFLEDTNFIANMMCECLVIEGGMAVNNALLENVISLFCSIHHPSGNLAQIIAGRPGSTKSASLDALVASSDPECLDARCLFFKPWKPIKKIVVQCTRETTPHAILRAARRAALLQSEEAQCILVLEEVGIAVGSKHNALMVLHALIDRGVELDDGKVVRIPIIGISNYSLDAAKMNRMRTTLRGNPQEADLIKTARTIMRLQSCRKGHSNVYHQIDDWVTAFCSTFRDLILDDNADVRIKWFYGMRDFYSIVAMMKRHIDNHLSEEVAEHSLSAKRSFLSHLSMWTLQINLGGHPDAAIGRDVIQQLHDSICDTTAPSNASWCLAPSAHRGIGDTTVSTPTIHSSQLYCDMCARICWYGENVLDPTKRFMLSMQNDGGQPCLTSIEEQTAKMGTLAYALYRTRPDVTKLYRVRNLLMFSRGNSALELLFRLGYLRKDNTDVIDPRDPAHITSLQIMSDLSQVRRCLRTNRTLVLLRAAHLYEALFDVLNQHFAIEKENDGWFYSTLTVDGITSTIPVSPDHRIIIIEDESNIHDLTSPFLNRCVKVCLDFENALSIPQRDLFERVKSEVGSNVPRALIPGFTNETLASHILNVNITSPCSDDTLRACTANVLTWLHTLVCPRRLLQAQLGLIASVPKDKAHQWKCNPIGTSLAAILSSNGSSLRQHIFVFTEQREISSALLIAALSKNVFATSTCLPQHVIAVNLLSDESLDHFVALGGPESATFGVFVIDLSTISGDTGTTKLNSLFHRISTKCPDNRRIVVIAVLPNSSKLILDNRTLRTNELNPTDFSLTDRRDWTIMYVDEVIPPAVPPIDPKHFVHHEHLKEALREAFAAVGSSRSLSVAQYLGSGEVVRSLEIVVKSLIHPSTPAFQPLAQQFVDGMLQQESLSSGDAWKTLALRTVRASDSLRDQLTTFLINIAQQAAQRVIPVVMEENSHNHVGGLEACRGSDSVLPTETLEERQALFLALLGSPIVPRVDYEGCFQQCETSAFATDGAPRSTCTTEQCRFPFSHRIEVLLSTLESADVQRTRFQTLLRDSCVESLSLDMVRLYASDIVRRRLLIIDVHALNCISSLLLLHLAPNRNLTIVDVHVHLFSHAGWLSDAFEWVRGIPSTTLELMALRLLRWTCIYHNSDGVEKTSLDFEIADIHQRIFRLVVDNSALPTGFLSLSKIRAIKGILTHYDNWELTLHQGLSMFPTNQPLPDDIVKGILGCINAEGLVMYMIEHYSPSMDEIALSLLSCAMPEESDIRPHVLLLEEALRCPYPGIPHAAWASSLRFVLQKWCALQGHPLSAFIGPRVLDEVHNNPSGERAQIVSKVFFDVWQVDTFRRSLQEKVGAAVENCRNAADGEARYKTFLRVGRSGVDGAAASEIVTHLIASRNPLTPVVDDATPRLPHHLASAQKYIGAALDNNVVDHHRREQIAWFISRTLYFEALDLGKFRDLINEDYQRAVPILPAAFAEVDFLAVLREPSPVLSVLHLFSSYAAVRNNLDQGRLPPPSSSRSAVAAAIFSLGTSCIGAHPFDINLLSTLQQQIFPKLQREVQSTPRTNSEASADAIIYVVAVLEQHPFIFNAMRPGAAVQPMFKRGRLRQAAGRHETVAYYASKVLDAIVAFLQALLMPEQHGVLDATVADAVRHIREQILKPRCPKCNLPFEDFDGCFSVTCLCGQCFCGWCFEMFPDAHAHVLRCQFNLNPGSYFAPLALWEISNNRRRVNSIQQYLQGFDARLRSVIVGLLLPDLKKKQIDVETIGCNPIVQPPVHLELLEMALSQFSAELLGNANGTVQAVWWLCSKMESDQVNSLDSWENVTARFLAPVDEDPLEFISTRQNNSTHEIISLLQLPDFFKEISTATCEVQRMVLPYHYLYRQAFDSVEAFWHKVKSDDTYSVLRPLHAATTAVPPYLTTEQNDAYCRILRFVGKLQVAAHQHHLSRKEAEKVTIAEWNEAHHFVRPSELSQLEKDVRLIWSCVEYVFCKSKTDLINGGAAPAVFETSSAKVCSLLPGSDINQLNGGFILSLLYGRSEDADGWKGLLESSTSIQQALAIRGVPQGPNAHHRFFRLDSRDLVEYDELELMRKVSLFVDPLAPRGGFTSNLPKIIDWIVSQPGVYGKPSLTPPQQAVAAEGGAVVPTFKFFDEASSSIIALQRRLPLELFAADSEVAADVSRLAQDDPEFSDAARSFVLVLIRELASQPIHFRLPPLAESAYKAMATPLTPNQQRAAEAIFTRFGRRVRTAQLIPLLAAVWESAHMNPLACVPLDTNNDEHADIVAGLKSTVHDLFTAERGHVVLRFLAAIKITCVMFLQPESAVPPGFFDGSVLDIVLNLVNDNAFEEHFEVLEKPFTIPHTLAIVQKLTSLFEDEVADKAHRINIATVEDGAAVSRAVVSNPDSPLYGSPRPPDIRQGTCMLRSALKAEDGSSDLLSRGNPTARPSPEATPRQLRETSPVPIWSREPRLNYGNL